MRCEAVAPDRPCACCGPAARRAMHRLSEGLSRRSLLGAAVSALALPDLARAQAAPVPAPSQRPILLRHLRLFDGHGPGLRDGLQVLVRGNRITAIEAAGVAAPDGAMVLDAGGRTLMPGLIDAHWHTMFAPVTFITAMTADIGLVYLAAGAEAERTLMRGFTTVRDAGGPAFALREAIDRGLISGPRIFPSGAMVSQTGGHGDFRMRNEFPRADNRLGYAERVGAGVVADGPAEVLRRVREQLALGASQVKLVGGGGISSLYDPLDTVQFQPDEIRAAVAAAADWNTYVMAHLYTPASIERYVQAGVRCVEHGQLADEHSARLIADHGVWWSMQPFIAALKRDRELSPGRAREREHLFAGTDRAYALAIRHKAKLAWGTDLLFEPAFTSDQGRNLTAMTRWFTPARVLTMATRDNAELLALSGPRSPYAGKLGVIEKNALADMLVVDGDPTHDMAPLANPQTGLRLIMKDGRIHKNTL